MAGRCRCRLYRPSYRGKQPYRGRTETVARQKRSAPEEILQHQRYALQLKDKLADMSDEEQFDLLAANGMLVKRPLIIGDDFVLVGFKEAEWERLK